MTTFSRRQTVPEIDDTIQVVIAIGETEGELVDTHGFRVMGLTVDGNLDATAITFKVATSVGGPLLPLYDEENVLISIPVGTTRALSLDPGKFAQWRFIAPVLNTAQVGAATTVGLVTRPV